MDCDGSVRSTIALRRFTVCCPFVGLLLLLARLLGIGGVEFNAEAVASLRGKRKRVRSKKGAKVRMQPDIDRNRSGSRVCARKTKAAGMISGQIRNVAILAALALAGCSASSLKLGATNYKGQPLSAVTAKLGQPNEVQTIAGQKAYIWRMGNPLYGCEIRVVMAGDVVDTYEGSGDVNVCSQYGALSGGLKGYQE